ncbi:MAG: nuclear transport factor 2 family protein [Pseudomonadota bacterium]
MTLASLAVPASAGAPRNSYEQAAVEAVQAHVNAYRTWDLDAFMATFAEDATLMLDGNTATGHAEIRRLYAPNFEDIPHSVKILESGVRKGLVNLTISYVFEDGYERCCSYSEYFVEDGKIAYLKVKMTNRMYQTSKSEPE